MAHGNRDFDGRPGSDSNSPSYDRIYNPDGYNERDAGMMDQATLVRQAVENAEDQAEAIHALRNAQSRVHYWPSVGKFIIPRDGQNCWAAHAELIKDKSTSLYFNPGKYVYFDKIIAEKFPAINAPENEGLRNNIAIMRNDIIGIYLKDGAFDPGDEKYLPCIQAMATTLGNALANDTWLRRPFTLSIDSQVANVEGVGAAEMYKFLLSRQDNAGIFQTFLTNVRTLLGMGERNWGLPPIEHTPFSPHSLSSPALPPKQCFTDTELQQEVQKAKEPGFVERCCNKSSTSRAVAP